MSDLVLDVAIRRESDGTYSARVLSDIGGRGYFNGYATPQDALTAVAGRIENRFVADRSVWTQADRDRAQSQPEDLDE